MTIKEANEELKKQGKIYNLIYHKKGKLSNMTDREKSEIEKYKKLKNLANNKEIYCDRCGKKFIVSKFHKNKARYCSKKCANESRRYELHSCRLKKYNNDYYKKNKEKAKINSASRYKYNTDYCIFCLSRAQLELHHYTIPYNIDSVICLCKRCHILFHTIINENPKDKGIVIK